MKEFEKIDKDDVNEEASDRLKDLKKLVEKEQKLQNLRDMNFQKNIAKVLSYTHGPKRKAEMFSKDKLHILYDASQFIKNVQVPERTQPKEQLKWLR